MAKHNYVMLNGQVLQPPRFNLGPNGEVQRALGPVVIIRGVRDFGNNIDNIKYDAPVVMTSDPALIKVMQQWEVGDMVEIKGSITTKDIVKSSTCKHCGEKNKKAGSLVYINPIYIGIHEKKLSRAEGLNVLKARCEISNQVTLIGPVCRDPQLYVTEKGLAITTYQMAVRRKFRIVSDSSDTKTDFPWIKSYGAIAKNDAASIKKGTYIFVDGMIQTRELERTQVCEHCGGEYKWNDFAMEIVPFATEYLRDFFTKEEIKKREMEQSSLAAKSVLSETDVDESRPTDKPDYTEDEDVVAKNNVVTASTADDVLN